MSRRQLVAGTATLVVAAVLMVIGLTPKGAEAPDAGQGVDASQVGSVGQDAVAQGCQLIQNMRYTPCGHEVTRRLDAPAELIGKGRGDVEAAYDQWRITEFLPQKITMERQMDIYCAQHVILMPDETGVLGVFENKYGDALAFVRSLETPMETLPEAVQEEIRAGKGFDTLDALEQWLESVES